MSKLVKIIAALLLIVGAIAVTPRPAEARWGHGWHGGWGHHWRGCCRGFSYAYYPRAYYYAVPYYYVAPRRFIRIHHWRHRHWGWRHRW